MNDVDNASPAEEMANRAICNEEIDFIGALGGQLLNPMLPLKSICRFGGSSIRLVANN
jgi:hypothetical protein